MNHIYDFEKLLNEGKDVKITHSKIKKSKLQTTKEFPFFAIKEYMGKGYWDKVNKNDFKKAYDIVIRHLLRPGSKTFHLSQKYGWITNFDELWEYQLNKEIVL